MSKERLIFGLFRYNATLRFSEIERRTGLRSNDVAYYLERLVKRGVLVHESGSYTLSAESMRQLPYFHDDDALSPLPVILVRCTRADGSLLLLRREKRPYEGLWSFPGGRMLLGESIEEASKRLVKEKTFLECTITGVRAVCNERVVENGNAKHGFLLLVVDAIATSCIVEKPQITWVEPSVSSEGIIPSDHFFLTAPQGAYECVLTPHAEYGYTAVITPITATFTPYVQ